MMIPKKLGDYMVTNLQARLLYDAEFHAPSNGWVKLSCHQLKHSSPWPPSNMEVDQTMLPFIKALNADHL